MDAEQRVPVQTKDSRYPKLELPSFGQVALHQPYHGIELLEAILGLKLGAFFVIRYEKSRGRLAAAISVSWLTHRISLRPQRAPQPFPE